MAGDLGDEHEVSAGAHEGGQAGVPQDVRREGKPRVTPQLPDDQINRARGEATPLRIEEDRRLPLGVGPPRALEPAAQVAFLRAVERSRSARDRAIAHLLFYTGLRIGECAALDSDDVSISARKGLVVVRRGKGDAYREVPLNAAARASLAVYVRERAGRTDGAGEPALFLNPQGRRLSTRAIDLVVRELGRDAGLALSAHVLRHTCLTALVRNGNDLVLVAEIAGHRRLETTRRYSLPSARDRAAAMDGVRVDY